MLLLFYVMTFAVVGGNYIELCCSFQGDEKFDVKVLAGMMKEFKYKLLMGCSKKVDRMCPCFSPGSGCSAISATVTDSDMRKRNIEVENAMPIVAFNSIMRTIHPQSKPLSKDTYYVHSCNKKPQFTPLLWRYILDKNLDWSPRRCYRESSIAQIQLTQHTVIEISKFDHVFESLLDQFHGYLPEFEKMTETIHLKLSTQSQSDYKQVLENIAKDSAMFNVTQLPDYRTDGIAELKRGEVLIESSGVLCKTYDIDNCLSVLHFIVNDKRKHTFHVMPKLQDLFLTTAPLPGILIVYKAGNILQAQELGSKLESALSQSTVKEYTVGVMEQEKYSAGFYYFLSPNTLVKCESETESSWKVLTDCVTSVMGYLPEPARDLSPVISSVFGEQHIGSEDHHRGNLNSEKFYIAPLLLNNFTDIRDKLQQLGNVINGVIKLKDGPGVNVVSTQDKFDQLLHCSKGHFLLFTFLSDVPSLHVLKDLLIHNNSLPDFYLVECFHSNLICNNLHLTSFPVVLFVRDNTTTRYTGPLTTVGFNSFRDLIKYPAVSTLSDIQQVDLVLAGKDYKAVVLVTRSGNESQEPFARACSKLHGLIRCYVFNTEVEQDKLISHVPEDSIMINKNHILDQTEQNMLTLLLKLTTPSVISDTQLLQRLDLLQGFTEVPQGSVLGELLLFDGVLDDQIAAVVVALFPALQFVQFSASSDLKDRLLHELIGYNYDAPVLYLSLVEKCGYQYPGSDSVDLEQWIREIQTGTMTPHFQLKGPQTAKYQYQNIFYQRAYSTLQSEVSDLKGRVQQLNKAVLAAQEVSHDTSHLEL